MLKDASKILDIIVEFCRENMNMLMIAGVALIVLVLVISLVRPSKEDDDFDFDEFAKRLEDKEGADNIPKDTKNCEKQIVFVQQPQRTAEIEAEAVVVVEEPKAKAEATEKNKVEDEVKIEETLSPKGFSKNTVSLGTIVEELAEITGEGVKKVEIKIPGAEVRITYLDEIDEAKDHSCAEATCDDHTAEKESLAEGQIQGENLEENQNLKDNTKPEDSAPLIRKFGPDNMNITRSGKVFSEEELQKQIRD